MTTEPIYSQCGKYAGYHDGKTAYAMKATPKGYRLLPKFVWDFPTERRAKNAFERYLKNQGDVSLFKKAVMEYRQSLKH